MRIRDAAWRRLLFISAFLVLVAGTLPAVAQPLEGDAAADLKREIEERFRVLPLSDGVLLEPRSEIGGVSAIQVGEGTLAVDGRTVSIPELRSLLGDQADPILRLYDMGPAGSVALFESDDDSATGDEPEEDEVAEPEPWEDREERDSERSRRSRSRRDTHVVVGNSVTIDADETAQEVVVFGGNVKVFGEVEGDAAAIGGSTWVEGVVMGSAIAIGGSVHLEPGAEVMGDVVSVGGRVIGADDADVSGEVVEVSFMPGFHFGGLPGRHGWNWANWDDDDWDFGFSPMSHMLGLAWDVFSLAILVLLAFLAVLLARGPVERIGRKVSAEPWKSGLVGLLAQILLIPLLCLVVFVLLISIIGIPLLLLVPFGVLALVLAAFLGYVAVAHQIGKWTEARFGWSLSSPYIVVLVGLGILQVWSLVGDLLNFGGPIRFFAFMFLVFGALLKYAAWTIGSGAALLTRFGTRDEWRRVPAYAESGPGSAPGVEPKPDFLETAEPDGGGWESDDGGVAGDAEPEDG